MNRLEVFHFLESFFMNPGRINGTALKPFFDLVSSLKKNLPLSIPLLRDFSAFGADGACKADGACATGDQKTINSKESIIKKRIDRRYLRLCRIQENLGKLDFKKAPPGVSPEDFIFSKIDFSRYREIKENEFDLLFREGLEDFDESFFKKTFSRDKEEIRSEIDGNYIKNDNSPEDNGSYKLKRDNPLILSIMHNLETSLESLPLFTAGEIQRELKELIDFTGGSGKLRNTELLYPLLVHYLDGVLVSHDDGMTTKLFIGSQGELAGTFRPGNKAWTRTLIPAEQISPGHTDKKLSQN